MFRVAKNGLQIWTIFQNTILQEEMIFIGRKTNEVGNAIKIKSIEAYSLYRVNKGYTNAFINYGDAVLNDNIFINYMKKHGMTVKKNNKSSDFIVMKFGYPAKDESNKKVVKTQEELRKFYYEEGAVVPVRDETIQYKMLMRSPGRAKEGDCVFIKEDLYDTARKYLTMGLCDLMMEEESRIVEMSAYSTMITATAIDYIHIPLKNILVVRDEEVRTQKKCLLVEDVQASDGKRTCSVREDEQAEVANIMWDGMGLIDRSIFPQNMEGFIYCRSHFFKSCLFKGNLQEYFKDYYGSEYENAFVTGVDMFGRKMKVTDIKVIITENSLKWLKFVDLMGGTKGKAFKYYKKFMKKDGERFDIIKTAHRSKWGELQRSSYQMNGSLPTTDKEKLKKVAEQSVNYCNALKLDHEAFREHLRMTATKYNLNEVLLALDEWNSDFKNTSFFRSKKTKIISKFKKERLQLGKLLQVGDNLTICGNPIALLLKATGRNPLEEGCFEAKEDVIQCYTTRFANGEKLAGFRNPHNSPNNIVYLENVYPNELQKYFPDFGDNIIVINGIGTDVQSRLNGQDLDSDSIYATNQKVVVELAEKAYKNYPTIINMISKDEEKKYRNAAESYAKMDNDIAEAQYAIGQASNLAQLALCYYYDGNCKNIELRDVFVICSVLAQVAIDSAKRNFAIDVTSELERIQRQKCMRVEKKYPRFFADVQINKGKKIKNADIKIYKCPMDILYQIIDEEVVDMRGATSSPVDIEDLMNLSADNIYKARERKQFIRITKAIEECNKKIKELDRDSEDFFEQATEEYEACANWIKGLKIRKETFQALLVLAFGIKGLEIDYGSRLLTLLYEKDKVMFLNCFKKTAEISTENAKIA